MKTRNRWNYESQTESPAQADHAAAARRKSAVILLVDDDEQIVRLLRLVLENHGYACLTAFGGAQALSQFSKFNDVDVIVTDLNMSCGDGLSFIQTVRRNSRIPIFIISGFVEEYARQMFAIDDVFILPKPVDTYELVKRIRACCRHRKGPKRRRAD